MKRFGAITFFVKAIIWGGLIGFCVLFFMPGSKLTFNWQVAQEWFHFYQTQKQLQTNEPDLTANRLDAANLSFATAVAKASPSVVSINVYHPKGLRSDSRLAPNQRVVDIGVGIGSGVIVSDQGYIVTNYHVIEGAESISINLEDGRKRYVEVVGFDTQSDIAVLHTDLPYLKAADLANSDEIQAGDVVMAIGSPFGGQQSVSLGIISAITYSTLFPKIQTDAAINTGNSGGALINTRGQVVGINQMILSSRGGGQTGVNYAIPIDHVNAIVKDLIEFGKVRRNWLGVAGAALTNDGYKHFFPQLEKQIGVFVTDIESKSPAETAGIAKEDLIIEFDGKPINDLASFYKIFYNTPLEKSVDLTVLRGEQKIDLTLKLELK